MYSFEPNEEQKMLIDAVRKFAAKDVRGGARDADEKGVVPHEVIDKGWELGLLQSSIPETYGGFGDRSALTLTLAAEELAYGDLATAMAIMAPAQFALPLLIAGSEEQKKSYLPKFSDGGYIAATAALVEPRFDFDANDLSVSARDDGDSYVLEGDKTLVSYAADAEHFLVYAKLDGKTQGFIINKGTEGLTVGAVEKNMGIKALPTYSLKLSNCRVPCADRLGGESGHDFAPILNASRVALTAMAVGLSRAAYDYALDYAKDREAFGEKIAQRQSIAFMLAEMATEIEATRLMAWEAAWLLDQGRDATREAYLAKMTADEVCLMVTDRALQILGGHGYIRDHPVEMWLRNGRGFPMFEGMAIV